MTLEDVPVAAGRSATQPPNVVLAAIYISFTKPTP
jgi:hypothetical protein